MPETMVGQQVCDTRGVGVVVAVYRGPFDHGLYYLVREHDGHEQYWDATQVSDA